MNGTDFISFAERIRRQTRDPAMIAFLDHAIGLAQKNAAKHGKFDRNAYQRELMRKRRAAERAAKKVGKL